MPTRLKETDVVIVGLGAAGGVAALPARTGRARRRRPRGRHLAHETRLLARRAPEQLSRLAAVGAESESRDSHASADRLVAHVATRRDPSDDERRGRNHAALLGAELAAEPVGLQGRERDDAPVRRVAHSERAPRSKTGRSASTSSSPTTTRSSTRSACPARRATSAGRSIAAATSSKARAARVSDAAAARHRLHRSDGGGRPHARLAPVPGTGGDQLAAVPEPLRVHVSRLLQSRRLSRRRQELDGGHDDSESAGDRPLEGRHARPRDDARGRWQRPRLRRELCDRRRGVLPAGEGRAAGELHLRERAAAAAVEVKRVSERALEQSRSGRAALLQPRANGRRHRPVSLEHEQLVRAAGAGRRDRRLGGRQLRPRRHWISSAAATSGSTRTGGRLQPPA